MLVALATLAESSIPYGDVQSLDDLYRLQRLYEMSQDPYLDVLAPVDDIAGRSVEPAQSLWGGGEEEEDEDSSLYNLPLLSGAQARDEEHLEHSALQGLHAVAGGTLEGEPAQKQVKTDKPLPAYCNPPNPCPLGKTAKEDNCVENFENTLDNNKNLMAKQDCPCDTEHMWSCPAGQRTVTSKGSVGEAALNKVMSELAELHDNQFSLESNPYWTSGVKRDKLVAKKSPGLVRRKRTQEQEEDWNPYFEGKQLEVAAKKSPEMIRVPAHP